MSFLQTVASAGRKGVLLCSVMLVSNAVMADSADMEKIKSRITSNMQVSLPNAKVSAINETPMEGVYQVELTSGELVYSDAKGGFIISGDLYELNPGAQPINYTENWRGKQRIDLLAKLDVKDMVVFPAEGESKGVVYAFTDVDCGYCQKFHSEIPVLNSLGVEVRYLAWPRAGLKSPTADKMRSVWCADDKKMAMTKAKRRLALEAPAADCETPMEEHLMLGHKMGVRGTPALFLADGTQAGGYLKATDLAAKMGIATAVPMPPLAP